MPYIACKIYQLLIVFSETSGESTSNTITS